MTNLLDPTPPAQMAPAGIDADQRAQHAVAARFDIAGRDPALDGLREALEGLRRARAEAAAEVCPCGEAANPLHAFLNHGGRR